jgi:MFS family permease
MSANNNITTDSKHDQSVARGSSAFPLAVSLPILVFIDMFAVALVVPLLFQYYKKAGVVSATQRELLGSVFSASQIIGGVLMGALTDAKVLRREAVLFLSFGGSALAYLMITYGGFTALILSRIMVGLVKQTMTVTTSMLTQCTTKENRTKHMGRLESSSTAAWILGPSAGALLFKCA